MNEKDRADRLAARCASQIDKIAEQDARIRELEGALMACLEKGARWHPCDPVVVKARAALKGE